MSMRVHTLATYLRPEEAYTLIEFLDPLREVLLQAYGEDITRMLQQATGAPAPRDSLGEEEPF